ncbi:hypothetical protein Poly41_09160 [Novipirellula artificiosorum]|uniref:Uncharacterized protein n=2 Tax=Novipirellula artificiosorum TaxID=2528016 RepID=A0A5C6E133_9BACT|nr:hypothetical protein Poly41_09160 [Novipirellula artificiosorum]
MARDVMPVSRREVIAAMTWTVLADLLLFRAVGFSGPAVFFALVPIVLLMGRTRFLRPRYGISIACLSLLVAIRLAWQGSVLTFVSAVALTLAISMAAAGSVPFVFEGIVFGVRVLFDGASRIGRYRCWGKVRNRATTGPSLASWLLPLASVLVFGALFLFANPDLLSTTRTYLFNLADYAWRWVSAESVWEIPFCIFALLVGAGLVCPRLPMFQLGPQTEKDASATAPDTAQWLPAFYNSLVVLILLFGGYLCFEFATLWKRDFPTGFYYAGYAHQGAAWLTVALALATLLLSAVFNGTILNHPRIVPLRSLAWVWSGLNLLLAIAVYNRLFIYVGYNGMTRMRTVGFFGITAVVLGFLLVLYKMAHHRSFWWLIRRQLMALALTVIAYSLFPVDWVAHRYNTSQVNRGYLHPSVMIAVKPIDNEGFLALIPLTDHSDEIIREGVLAMLASRQSELEGGLQANAKHWTSYQASEVILLKRLRAKQSKWAAYLNAPALQAAARNRFEDYAMQWY